MLAFCTLKLRGSTVLDNHPPERSLHFFSSLFLFHQLQLQAFSWGRVVTGVHLQPDRCISCSVPYHSGSCSCIQSQLSEQGQWRTKRSLLQIPSMAFSEHCDPGLNPGWLLCRLHTSLLQTTRLTGLVSNMMARSRWHVQLHHHHQKQSQLPISDSSQFIFRK